MFGMMKRERMCQPMKRIKRKDSEILYVSELIELLQSAIESGGDMPVCIEESYKGDDKGFGVMKDVALVSQTMYGYESVVCISCGDAVHGEKIPEEIKERLELERECQDRLTNERELQKRISEQEENLRIILEIGRQKSNHELVRGWEPIFVREDILDRLDRLKSVDG
jgi:hypothetical protein